MSKTIEYKTRAVLPFSVSLFLVCIMVSSTFAIILTQQPAHAAPLSSRAAIPSNNIVTTTSTYEIMFNTATTGTIKTIEIAFPSGYNVAGTRLIERTGIEAGAITINENTVVFTITSPVSKPAGTPIRLELSNIVNKVTTSSSSVTITTKGVNGAIIDGPTSASVPLKQIGSSDIANNAVGNLKIVDSSVTGQKIADGNVGTNDLANNAITGQKIVDGQVSSKDIGDNEVNSLDIADSQVTENEISPVLMFIRTEADTNCVPDQFGNMVGWCPDGSKQNFAIDDPDLEPLSFNKFVPLLVIVGGVDCRGYTGHTGIDGRMNVDCDQAPTEGAYLAYTAIGPKVLP